MALTKAQLIDLNGNELILDLDADTSITADTDDQIDIKIGGADDFRFTANTFTALSGSGIVVPDGGLTFGSTAISATAAEINLIDGGASTGTTAVADADGIITNDGGTMRLTTAATFKTYFQEGISQAYDDFTIGDAAVLITTSAGNITIDAAANDSDIIFKGTDGGADKVFMTIDGSAGGDLFLTGGLIDLKNDGSAVSQIKFYCESSNAHAQTLIGAPHAQSADNTLTLPDGADGVLLSTTSTATVTNKTLTSPIINTGTFGTSILPVSADGTTLGSASKEFSDLFLADSSTIQFGNDQDTTLTHTDGAGLTLNSTNKLMFNDASQFIQGTSATVLSIGATDEIDLTATAVDLNGTLNVSGVATFQATPVFPDGSLAVADLDIDGATDIGAAIVDADLFIVDDGAGGTNRKTTAARIKTYATTGAITTITSLLATDIKIGEDDQTKIDFETADQINFYAANANQIKLNDGVLAPVADNDVDLGTASLEFKDGYFDGTLHCDVIDLAGTEYTAIPAVANGTDNRVMTSTGGINIQGETNLTYDGSVLTSNALKVLGAVRVQNATTGTGTGDGLLIENSGNDVYFNQKENAPIYFRTNNADTFRIAGDGVLTTGGETAGDVIAGGITIDGNAGDALSLSMKSSDVNHGNTDNIETDTFYAIQKGGATTGGVVHFTSSTSTEQICNWVTVKGGENTATNTGAGGTYQWKSAKASGTGSTGCGSTDNAFTFRNDNSTRWLLKSSGEAYSDVGVNTFDEYDDAALVRAYDLSHGRGVVQSKFDKWVSYNHETLAQLKICGREDDGTPNTFVSQQRLSALHNGAIWQQNVKHNNLLNAVYELASESVGKEKADAILQKHEIKLLN